MNQRTPSRTVTTLTLAALALGAPQLAAAQALFLSSGQVYAPGEQPEVRLETTEQLEDVQLRLYEITDPAAYFDKQADLHRPSELVKTEETGLSLLRRGLWSGLQRARSDLYGGFTTEGRLALQAALPDYAYRARAQKAPSKLRIKPLSGHPLVDQWMLAQVPPGSRMLPLPVRKAGVYLLEASAASRAAHTIVVVSDIALVTKQSPEELLVWAVNTRTGAPMSGVQVNAKVLGAQAGAGSTDGSGLARLKITDAPATVLYAKQGKSFALLDPRYYPSMIEMPRTYLFTDRPVYRPEQLVRVKGFTRDWSAGGFTAVPAGLRKKPVQITVRDARGRLFIKRGLQARLDSEGGFDAQFKLPKAAAYGTWTVTAKIGKHSYSGEFKLMVFKKPEARLSVTLQQRAVRSGDPLRGEVVGRFFSGAAYQGAKVKITATRTRFYVPWYVDAAYSWYFADSEYHQSERQVIGEVECTLDGEGRCGFDFKGEKKSEDYTYVIEAVSQDPGGKTIVGVARASVTQGAFYLAVEPKSTLAEPGEAQEVVVRALRHDGAPVQTQVTLTAGRQVRAEDGVMEWVEEVREQQQTDAKGLARFKIELPKTGYYELRANAQDDKQVQIQGEGFLFSAEQGEGIARAPSELMLVTDKKSYFVGDTAQVLLLTPSPEAHTLFSVEGTRLDRAEVVKTAGHVAILEVKIGEEQSPNFFISATALIGGELYSRRQTVIVPPRERLLSVAVTPSAKELRPGAEAGFTVQVKDYKGAPVPNAAVALTVVDEAIYDVSPELVAPIEAFFYPRKRDNVRTTDSASFRFFGRARAPKGGAARRAMEGAFVFGSLKPQLDDRTAFRDSAGWFPSLKTGADGSVAVKFTLPDNVTTWRATARVISPSTQVGSGKGKLIARTPVLVRASFPAQLTVGDEGEGLVQVQNLSGEDGTFRVSLKVSGLTVEWQDQDLTLENGRWGKIPFKYKADKAGAVQFNARAESPRFKDGMLRALKVLPWQTRSQDMAAGRTSALRPEQSYGLQLPAVADRSQAELHVHLMNSGLAAVQDSLPYLVSYPHGCVEQTMSRFVPLLAAKRAMKSVEGMDAEKIDELVAAGLNHIAELENEGGGWGWFGGEVDPGMTAFVTEGLAEAKKLGAPVDPGMARRATKYLRRALQRGRLSPDGRAFVVYALARQGRKLPRMVSRLIRDGKAGKLTAIGASYTLLAAKKTRRKSLVDDAQALLLSEGMMERPAGAGIAAWCTSMDGAGMFGSQGCTALALLALTQTKGPKDVIRDAENYLTRFFDGESFGPTLATGLAVRALAAAAEAPAKGGTVKIYLGDKELGSHRFGSKAASIQLTPKIPATGRGQFKVVQQGPGRYYHTISLVAPDRQPQLGAQSEGGLVVSRSYRPVKTAGRGLKAGRGTDRFAANDLVLVELEVESDKALEYVLIADPHPAGLSPVQRAVGKTIKGRKRLPKGVHREYGAGATNFFVAKLPKGRSVLSYLARAGLPGKYRALPTQAEAMYQPKQYAARSDSDTVEVR